jgi:hypothetical protein
MLWILLKLVESLDFFGRFLPFQEMEHSPFQFLGFNLRMRKMFRWEKEGGS